MIFDFIYITPEQAFDRGARSDISDLDGYIKLAKSGGECELCDNEKWKLANTGLCFSCTTGTTDASTDYELVE